MVEFQRLTGCRPGEACNLRLCDIDMSGSTWLYRPTTHKTAWKGKSRTVAIGPRAQAILKEFFTLDISDYLFSPKRAMEKYQADRAADRKTPKYPSHMARNAGKRKARPKRAPKEKYDSASYARACDQAFPPSAPLAKQADETLAEWDARLDEREKAQLAEWRQQQRWHPNQ
jgi:hypothetical protein